MWLVVHGVYLSLYIHRYIFNYCHCNFFIWTGLKIFHNFFTVCEDETAERVVFIKSERGKDLALHNGYQYYEHRANVNGTTIWRCGSRKKRQSCSGSIATIGRHVIRWKVHTSCTPNYINNKKKTLDYKWMTQINPEGDKATTLCKKMVKEYEEAGLQKPTYKQVYKLIGKAKKIAQHFKHKN